MENDLIFDAKTSDALFDASAAVTQIAAAGTPPEQPMPSLRDAAQVVVPQGETVVRVPVTPGEVVELPFPADAHFLAQIENGNLAIKVGDLTIILQGYAEAAGATPPVIESADGQPLDIAAILAATDPSVEIETAAGAAGAQGQGADNTGALLTQFAGAEGGLGGFTGAGSQGGSDTPGSGPGVDQTGTLFKQFGGETTPTAPNAPDLQFTTDEESKIAGKLVATDPQGDPLTYSLVGAAPAGLTFNKDGSWSFDPVGKYDQLNTDSPGQVSFQYKANDGGNDSNTATVTIDINGVNDAPKFTQGLVFTGFSEDEPSQKQKLEWKIADPDDTEFTFTVDESTLPPGVTFDSATRTFQFDFDPYDYLAEGESTKFAIKVTVTDAHGGSFEQDFGLGIQGVNDAPVAADDIVLTNAGTGFFGVFSVPEWALLVNDKDVDSPSLDVSPFVFPTGFEDFHHDFGKGNAGSFTIDEDGTLGGSIGYRATDESTESNPARVNIQNQEGGDITGTDADEILVGGRFDGKLDGGGGNDILTPGGGSTFDLYGGAGDDILQFIHSNYVSYHGGTDSVALSGGLAADAANHGDVLVATHDGLDLAEIAERGLSADGIETISSQAKFGAGEAQALAVTAASVQQLSDHTITPGGGFGEHEAIRIDSDDIDQIYLREEGGKWVDTGIEMAGYRIYAHETTGGDPAMTDAYVMVQAANASGVYLNQDVPVAVDDVIVTNNGFNSFNVPHWALTANDKNVTGDVTGFSTTPSEVMLDLDSSFLRISDKGALGGTFKYYAEAESVSSVVGNVKLVNQVGGDLNGTAADEILVGSFTGATIHGNDGNDIIFSGAGVFGQDQLYGDAGDDIIALVKNAATFGGTDNVAASGGLAASAENHGDVLAVSYSLNFSSPFNLPNIRGIETISMQEKVGGSDAQRITIGAAVVQQLSDHTITPGGAFGEHEAIRIDGDATDQIYLSLAFDVIDGSGWVDTGITLAGYKVYAHEATYGDPATTTAYVMVQAANSANVHLNQDGVPVAVGETVLANVGTGDIVIPDWALLANDKDTFSPSLDITDVDSFSPGDDADHSRSSDGSFVKYADSLPLGGGFTYKAIGDGLESAEAVVNVQNQSGGDITGTAADEILIAGSHASHKLDGGGGNDIIVGIETSEIFGGAGDDTIAFRGYAFSEFHGGADTVAASGGLAAAPDNHGDVLVQGIDFNLTFSLGGRDGIETISAQEKFGAIGAQVLTIGAFQVRQLSDHTIAPGGGFGEHEAIRIDGDTVDQVYLSKDSGQWVDTGIESVGYRIYAHEATAGEPATTDAFVMVQAANIANVHLNLDQPVAQFDVVLTTAGKETPFIIPEWALLANDLGANLDVVGKFGTVNGVSVNHAAGQGANGFVLVVDDDTLDGSFTYKATDGSSESAAAFVIVNDVGKVPVVSGTAEDEILIGTARTEKLDGGVGNDIIFGNGSDLLDGTDQIFGGAGDDILASSPFAAIHGGTDSVSASGGLAAGVDQHGDVLLQTSSLDLVDSAEAIGLDGIETISTQEKFGAIGMQILTLDAANVQQLSDHTITPGGLFGEHEAIRIDGDLVDQLYLSISKDGGKWVDTGIESSGYHIFAHETGGNAASTDAYVMVQAANIGNVHLNADGVPVAVADTVLANRGADVNLFIPEWALLANDKSLSGAALDVTEVDSTAAGDGFAHTEGFRSNGYVFYDDNNPLGGSLTYKATDGGILSEATLVTIQNQSGGGITGTAADEILVTGKYTTDKIDGGGGNDIIFGSSGGAIQTIFGGAGDDIVDFGSDKNTSHGGTDNVASSGGLTASADNHGDVLIAYQDLDLADPARAAHFDGFETISMQGKFGAVDAQILTISAAGVQQLSDHNITPGGVFAEHAAIRIDGDLLDQLYLSISKDGGNWVDTGIAAAGYQIYAHETTAGDAASTDAYVMVQTANTGYVHLNQDGQ